MENYFKSVFGAYDGLHTDTFKHIPEIVTITTTII